MTTLRKAAQRALEMLEDAPYISNRDDHQRLERVIASLRAALESPPSAWEYKDSGRIVDNKDGRREAGPGWRPLYE